jgi:hypothetical protein
LCDAASPSPSILWPPNHENATIDVNGVSDPDGNSITIEISSIFQDEPVSGRGSGNTAPDGVIVDPSGGSDIPKLRAERDGSGDGRVYHINFAADDGQGGTCTGEVMVSVPHDQSGAPAVDGGAVYDSTTP